MKQESLLNQLLDSGVEDYSWCMLKGHEILLIYPLLIIFLGVHIRNVVGLLQVKLMLGGCI